MKYNSYIQTKHPDWGYLETTGNISDDPLGIRVYVNQLLGLTGGVNLGHPTVNYGNFGGIAFPFGAIHRIRSIYHYEGP